MSHRHGQETTPYDVERRLHQHADLLDRQLDEVTAQHGMGIRSPSLGHVPARRTVAVAVSLAAVVLLTAAVASMASQ
ncbi:MAG: hypothetical protein MUF33_15785, partial [Candidatus Nanopelagicales bacterium]|nr:hypothetical protein [Candidatus Nanopelagicales bacterium]